MSSIRFSLPSESESLNIVMQNHQHADPAIDARRIRARCQGPESVKLVENSSGAMAWTAHAPEGSLSLPPLTPLSARR